MLDDEGGSGDKRENHRLTEKVQGSSERQSETDLLTGNKPLNYSEKGSIYSKGSLRFPSQMGPDASDKQGYDQLPLTDIIEEKVDGENNDDKNKQQTLQEEQQNQEEEEQIGKLFEGTAPLARTWWIQRIFFTWLSPVVNHTNKYRKQLTVAQYGQLAEKDKIEKYIARLKENWQRRAAHPNAANRNTLFFSLIATFKWQLLFWLLLSETSVCITMVQPFMIQILIDYIKTGDNEWAKYNIHFIDFSGVGWMKWLTEDKQYGLTIAMILVLSQMIRYIIDENTQYGQNILGAKASCSLAGLVYQKNIRVYPSSTTEFSQGEIVNFVQTDCQTCYGLMQWLPFFLCLPLMLVICLYLIFTTMGPSFFACFGVIAVCGIMIALFAVKLFILHKKYMAKQDKRLNITTECLNNIKMVKLYSWIDIFLKKIDEKRTEEMAILKTKIFFQIMLNMIMNFMPSALQATAFVVFIGVGNSLDLTKAFFMISVFSIIQLPLKIIPIFIGYFSQFLVSLKRIQRFLLLEEINQTVVDNGNEQSSDFAAEIKNGSNFIWGLKKKSEEKKEEEHKKVLEERKAAKKGSASRKSEKDGGSAKKKVEQEEEEKRPELEERLIKDDKDDNPYIKKEESPDAQIDSNAVKQGESASQSPKKEQEKVKLSNLTVLKSMNLQLKKGQLICIIGDVGSGKSSLLSALLGDLQFLNQEFLTRQSDQDVESEELQKKVKEETQVKALQGKAPILVNQSISYAQQVPWIQNKSIRDNIIFGYELDQERYDRVIKICELTRDLEILPSGDLTEIGEKGINLSGGQKARVGLARAVYANKDMILMDDPISALDSNVKKNIFTNVFLDELKGKTRILVTHAVDFLHLVDQIILLKDGEVLLQGSFDEIKNEPYLIKLMEIHKQHEKEKKKLNKSDLELVKKKSSSKPAAQQEENILQISQGPLEVSLDKSIDALVKDNEGENDDEQAKMKEKGKIISNEDEESIEVNFQIYKQYFMDFFGGWAYILGALVTCSFFLFTVLAMNYIIGAWSHAGEEQHSRFTYYALMTYGTVFINIIAIICRASNNQLFSWYATRKLHRRMINKILYAPVNLYFDTTPIGRILNRFSKDLNSMENGFSDTIGGFMTQGLNLMYVIVVAILSVVWVIVLLPVILVISFILVRKTVKPIKETVRVQSTTKSPVLQHLGETISGASTIRAFRKTDEFMKKNDQLLNNQILATQVVCGVTGWFGIRVDILSFILMIILYVTCILSRGEASDPVILAMMISSILAIQDSLMWSLKCFLGIHNTMVSAARCMKLIEVQQERTIPMEVRTGAQYPIYGRLSWPEQGKVEFKDVSLRYRPTTEIVLHKLSFTINSGEKIGIVGRTGAGKSTICLAISRIVEIFEGQIMIDDVNIQDIDLQDLRNRVTLIPQDPTMFTGTLRFNLDPEDKCTDDQILEILQAGQLQNLLDNDPKGLYQEITDNGGNLSSGERQLICICRAILRKSKLVVLDEATANIDMVTEEKIQNLITTQFQNSTMITIAHRLNTIINSDRVLVLGYGQILEYDSPKKLTDDKDSEFSKLLKELEKKKE